MRFGWFLYLSNKGTQLLITGQITGGDRLDVEAGSEVSELNDTHEDMENDDDIKPVDNEEDSPVHIRSKAGGQSLLVSMQEFNLCFIIIWNKCGE